MAKRFTLYFWVLWASEVRFLGRVGFRAGFMTRRSTLSRAIGPPNGGLHQSEELVPRIWADEFVS